MGNYTVTCSSHGSVIYSGQSKSDYDYYRNGSRQCSRCVAEDNQSARDAAVRRAEQAARDERDRVLARQKELERLERIRQKDLESEREKQRKAEKVRLLAARREQELKRERIKKEMLAKTTEEIMEQAKKFERLKSQTKNPFTQYKKLNTLQTVTDIRDKVSAVAYVGAVVSERVNAISADLEQTLGDDYDIIKSEMDRYKKYGTQMQSMTDVFISEFKKVFPNKNQNKNNVDEMVEDHNESTQADDDEKEWYKKRVGNKLKALTAAISNIEAKLFLMEQYYDQMSIDYKFFETFVATKKDELSGVTTKFKDLADLLRNVERGVLEGSGERQQMVFDAEYEVKVHDTENTGFGMGNAIMTGAVIGAGVGLVVGAVSGGLPGAVIGCVGGAVTGAAIGALCAWINPEEYKTVITTRKEKVTYVADESMRVTYKGKDQAKALDDIVAKLESSAVYKKLKGDLEKSEEETQARKTQLLLWKENMAEIGQNVRKYKTEIKKLSGKFKTENQVSEDEAEMINKKMGKLCVEIQSMLGAMKSD